MNKIQTESKETDFPKKYPIEIFGYFILILLVSIKNIS